MPFFRDMSDRVWSFISPRKTQHRREKPFKAPTAPVKAKTSPAVSVSAKTSPNTSGKAKPLIQMNIEPTSHTKVSTWKFKTPESAEAVDGSLLPPSPPASIRHMDDFEGDTMIHESIERSPSEISFADWDANDETLVVDDGKYMTQSKLVNRDQERLRRDEQGAELREAGWSEDSIFLFQKLGLRGFEPLLPNAWINDFDSLPVDLFTANEDVAFIKPESGDDFRAQHALVELFALGGLVRDAVTVDAPFRTSEYRIREAVRKYNRWAMKDGDLEHVWDNLSLSSIVIADKYTHSSVAEERMIRKLERLQKRWLDALKGHTSDKAMAISAPEEPPTLYGVIASFTVLAFVSFVPPFEPGGKGSLRMIAMFDFSKDGYDVWNSLAIAIFVVHCRNRMRQLREFLPDPIVEHERDPDV